MYNGGGYMPQQNKHPVYQGLVEGRVDWIHVDQYYVIVEPELVKHIHENEVNEELGT